MNSEIKDVTKHAVVISNVLFLDCDGTTRLIKLNELQKDTQQSEGGSCVGTETPGKYQVI